MERDTKPRVNKGIVTGHPDENSHHRFDMAKSPGAAVRQEEFSQPRQDVKPNFFEGAVAGHYNGQSCWNFKCQSRTL